ncbi:MAG TPA: oligogalacturonate-specific porin KdgM family protein [Spirochaetota bacterium]|nr:oligogalacturonate-specific porin KdgM family protein [Spirochaetota bacterium]
MNYKADMFDLTLIMAKVWEPNTLDTKSDDTTEKNDVTFYGADATLKLNDDIKIRPALYLIQAEKNQNPADSKVAFVGKTAMIPSIGANMKFGDITVDFAGAYGNCAKDENDVKYSGYAVDLSPAYKLSEEMKVGGFFTLLSGDDGSSATKSKSFADFTLKADGWGRMYLLENMQTFNNAGDHAFADIRGNSSGYMLVGAFFSYKLSDIEVKVQGAWGRLNKVASGAKKDLGVEFDGQLSYEVEKNAKLIFECAYLATGKAFGEDGAINTTTEKQKALYSALGMSYKW